MISALLLVLALTAAADEDPSDKGNSETSAAEATAEETPPADAPTEEPKTESAGEDADATKADEKPPGEKKPPTLRLRKSKKDDEAQDPVTRGEPKSEQPPAVPDRNIPNPDEMKVEPSELDKELLGELGQDLEAAQDEEDPLLRAGRRMREVEEKLAQLEVGDEMVELQDKILADLDELLKQKQNGKPPPKNQPQNQKKNQNDQQQMAQQQQQRQQSGQQRQEKQVNDSRDGAGPARQGREEFGTPKEVKDVWGHLSELMREEMSQYAKEGFLEKYREMLEQYYSTIATRSSGSE